MLTVRLNQLAAGGSGVAPAILHALQRMIAADALPEVGTLGAIGTGDLAIELARRVGPQGEVTGSDFSEGMLELARGKAPKITFEWYRNFIQFLIDNQSYT